MKQGIINLFSKQEIDFIASLDMKSKEDYVAELKNISEVLKPKKRAEKCSLKYLFIKNLEKKSIYLNDDFFEDLNK